MCELVALGFLPDILLSWHQNYVLAIDILWKESRIFTLQYSIFEAIGDGVVQISVRI